MGEPDDNSRYDNFLSFLDEANVQSESNVMSPLTQQTMRSQESSKFVDIMSFLTESESQRGDAVSKIDRRTSSSSRRGHDNRSQDSETVSRAAQASVDEVTAKVKAMKLELHEKSQLIRTLQSEYKHIRNSRDKKVEKLRVKWEKQLKDARSEFDSTLQGSMDMRDQVQTEIRNYEEKGKALAQRLETSRTAKESVVENMNHTLETQLRRAKRQLEEEEAKRFERDAAGRLEGMKRAARDHFAPELEKTVAQNKHTAQTKTAENEIRYTKLKRALQLDYDKKLAEARETIKQYLKTHEMRCKETSESKVSSFGRQLDEELDIVKEKYRRQTATMEETAEKAARKQLDMHTASLAQITNSEKSAMEQLLKRQSAELHSASESLNKQQQEWSTQYEIQLKHLESSIGAQIASERDDQLEKLKIEARGQISVETEQMLMKVRDEINNERCKLRDSLDQELDELRVKQQQAMDELTRAEEKARGRFKVISKEFEDCKSEKAELTALAETQSKMLSELRKRMHELRISLRNVEEEEAAAALDNNLNVDKRVKDNEYLVREWRDKVEDNEGILSQTGPECELRKQKLVNRLQVRNTWVLFFYFINFHFVTFPILCIMWLCMHCRRRSSVSRTRSRRF